jgi:hypothetical protein
MEVLSYSDRRAKSRQWCLDIVMRSMIDAADVSYVSFIVYSSPQCTRMCSRYGRA